MKKPILKLFLFVSFLFGFTLNTIAQSVTQYNDRNVRPNSIIVKYDNTTIKVKGVTTTPQQMALTVKNDFNATVKSSFKKWNTEEWEITGDLSSALSRLNRIPGVKAFPNYVYKRDAMTPTMLDLSDVDLQLKPELHGTNKTRPSTTINKSVSLGNLESFSPINRVYDENFDDTATVNSQWTVVDFIGDGNVWEFEDEGTGDFIYQMVGDTADTSRYSY